MRQNHRGFTIIEILVSLTIMVLIFGLLITIIRSSTFFWDLQDKKTLNASKRIISDFSEIFLQYPVYSGAVYADSSASKYFDRVWLVYSGGTIIIGVADKNTGNILDPNANDNGFIWWRAVPGLTDVSAYTGMLDAMSQYTNITNLKAYYGSWLIRIELGYDTEIINGNRENYASGTLLLVKNINH